MSPLDRAVALIRANPALAIAGVGVAGVLVLPAILNRRQPEGEAAEPPPAPVYGAGYGVGLTSGGGALESDALASQINEGNNLLLGEVGRLREQLAAANRTPAPAPPLSGGGDPSPTPRLLPPVRGQKVPIARSIGQAREQRRLNRTETQAILALYGLAGARPPESARTGAYALVAWARAERARRIAARQAAS